MIEPFRKRWARAKPKITREIIDYILDPKTLRQWAHLNLQDRCREIQLKFDVKLCQQTLGRWYRRNGVTKTRIQFKSYGAFLDKKLKTK